MEKRTEKKNNRKAVLLLLLVMIIAAVLISGTYARYTASASATGSVTVAEWSFDLNGTDMTTETVTFDLFGTIKDSDGTSDETDVTAGMIAPGTTGSFTLEMTNTSDVTAQYGLAFASTATNIPLEYRVIEISNDGTETTVADWADSLAGITASDSTKIAIDEAEDVRVDWRWPIGTTAAEDTVDTDLGIASAAGATPTSVGVTATLTVTQVD